VRHDDAGAQFGLFAQFQSTCLREARRAYDVAEGEAEDFNPRAYVRHDSVVPPSVTEVTISIHVPT